MALALLPCSLILAYQGLQEENLDQKSPGPPGWGLMQQASPLLIKKQKLLKSYLMLSQALFTSSLSLKFSKTATCFTY